MDAPGPDGAAPLHVAARHGHAGVCEALCEVTHKELASIYLRPHWNLSPKGHSAVSAAFSYYLRKCKLIHVSYMKTTTYIVLLVAPLRTHTHHLVSPSAAADRGPP